ncbi:uncharacterized protein JCM15063_001579 [Sporobolomyces koalae]|uniref:uncharacterized protein n=1 Tax=Sporobolomyces koalae TaxID=500713 RepID=UPI003173BAB7
MLARGAACDTCRARKVKCDALRPHCSPCLKSARGNTTVASEKCAYEGTSVAIATANRAAEIQKNGGTKRKRRQTKNPLVAQDEASETGPRSEEANKRKKQDPSVEDHDVREHSRDSSRGAHTADEDVQPGPRYTSGQVPSVFMDPQSYRPPSAASPTTNAEPSFLGYSRPLNSSVSASSAPWPPARPVESSYSQPLNRYAVPPPVQSDRYPLAASRTGELPDANSVDKGQLAGRVAQLERQLKLQDPHAASHSGRSTPTLAPLSNSYSSTYAPPSAGARSPSFPYATYSSYNPPTPGYNSYGSNYSNNSPSATSFPPHSAQSSQSSHSHSHSQYPPIQLAPSPALSQSLGHSTVPSGLHSFDPSRRRSLSTLTAIAGAVAMEEYPAGTGPNSPVSAWPAHQHHHQDSLGSGYRYSTSSPVSSTRHLGTEPQAFALTSSTSSPGRNNWNTTTSSLRTEMTNYEISPPPPPQANPTAEYAHAQATEEVAQISPPTTANASSSAPSFSNSTSPPTSLPHSVETLPSDPSIPANTVCYEPFDLGNSMFPLLDLSYPASLPPLSVLRHLVSTFFKRAAVPSTMLSKAKLFYALSLSPTDPRWPDEALLHAICAYACMFVSDESLGGGEYGGLGMDGSAALGGMRLRYWQVEGDQSARDYHYKKAKLAIEQALSLTRSPGSSRNLFQVLQGVVLTCYVAYLSALFSDLWMLAGTATRLIAPLGLNHLEPWDFDRNRSGPPYQDWGIRVRSAERNELLGPVKNLAEHWERSVTFWLAFAVDRFASANTDWTTSIDEKDISTHLPCAATPPMPSLSIDPKLCHIPSLYFASPSFLEDTSAPIGSLGLYIKATILLGRVVNYTQRFPRYLLIPMGGSCSSIKRDMKAAPDFVELDVAISKFKASHSANFFDNAGSSIDGFLASAYVVPHVCTILLHETLTDRYDRTPSSSLQRCLVAAKCIINSTYILYQSSYDLGGVDPFLPFCWSVAGRALVRDYTTRQYWGESEEADTAKQLAEHCLSFLRHCGKSGSRISQRLTETLEKHLEHPEALLPLDAGCNVVFDLNDEKASHAFGMAEDERKRELASTM